MAAHEIKCVLAWWVAGFVGRVRQDHPGGVQAHQGRLPAAERLHTLRQVGCFSLPPSLSPFCPPPIAVLIFLIFFPFLCTSPPLPHKFPQVANPTVINFGLSQMKRTGSAVEVPQCKGDNHFLQVKSISWSKMLTFDFVVVVL